MLLLRLRALLPRSSVRRFLTLVRLGCRWKIPDVIRHSCTEAKYSLLTDGRPRRVHAKH